MDQAKEVRKGEELNWDALEDFLRQQIAGLDKTMKVAQFHGGHANLTYLITFEEQEYVLRRPPFGKLHPELMT